ncbi:MAG TPA: methyltransferase domain-containing protein [Solirubrobacteraceae bacterium]|nr:methyltransferase domain-containing protein [Solirubrobacteraceae bacterium]
MRPRELRTAARALRRAASTVADVGAAAAGAGGLELRAPDRERALDRYQAVAGGYDVLTLSGDAYRQRAVDRLALGDGEVVLDVGCGTGRNLPALSRAVGPRGRVIGIELCPAMAQRARERAEALAGVTVVAAPAEEAGLPVVADAALLCATHDILRSPPALANVVRHVRPGGRIVAGGPKWAPWWRPGAAALNLWTWQVNRPYVTTFAGFDRPWSGLEDLLGDVEVEEVLYGGGFIAAGTRP